MYVCISGWVCSACYPWASVSFWAHHTVAPCWHRWPRFRYKCALIAIPVTARTEPSRAYARQALGSMGSLVRFMGHNCTSASCGAWSLSHNTEDGLGVGREAREEGARPMLLLCMPFVVRVAVSLLLCGCLLLLYTLDMLYLTISITLCSPSRSLLAYLLACQPKSIQRRNSRWRQLKVQSWTCPSIQKDIVNAPTQKHCATRFIANMHTKLQVKWD